VDLTPDTLPTVLLVEDNQAVRELILYMLEAHGYKVLGAESAERGLELFEQNRTEIRMVIVDMVMPGISGLDLAAELVRRCPQVQILYISGIGDSVAIQGLLRNSFESVLVKPFTEDALINRVAQLLQRVTPAA